MSDESIELPAKSDNSLAPSLSYISVRARVKLGGLCLKQDKATFTHGKVVNICIVYEINLWSFKQSDDPTLGNSLFGAIKLVKNTDTDKCKYSGYGIECDTKGAFSLSNGSGFGKKCNNFWIRYELFCACQQQTER